MADSSLSSSSLPAAIDYKTNNPLLQRAYSLRNEAEAKTLYDEWANTYDQDLGAEDYQSPTAAVSAINAHLPPSFGSSDVSKLKILDAGCGTGLVGLAIALAAVDSSSSLKDRVAVIDGLDLSQGMLDVARKTGVYGMLEPADLTKRIERDDGEYDVVVCVGTLTKAHVGPECLEEFVRVVKPGRGREREGGLVVATILTDIWESGGFARVVRGLEKDGMVQVLATDDFGIRKGQEKGGTMLVLKKL